MLNWIKNEYGNPPLYITENGVSDHNGTLQDQHRIEFYELYINNVMKGQLGRVSSPLHGIWFGFSVLANTHQ